MLAAAPPLHSRDAFEEHCRARASAIYIGDRTLLCRVMGQFLCYVDSDDATVGPHLAMDGLWEAWNSLAIARHVQPGWCVADVGANHGYFTLLLASLVGPAGRVFAVEPNPRLCALLERTIRVNGFGDRVTLLPCAAGAIDASVELSVPRGCSGDGSTVLQRGARANACVVDQRRLDRLVDRPLDFLKIDAEGADYDVLEGARGAIRRDAAVTVLLEHHASFVDDAGRRLARAIEDGFPLQYVGYDGEIAAATPEDFAADRQRFWDAWLTRAPH